MVANNVTILSGSPVRVTVATSGTQGPSGTGGAGGGLPTGGTVGEALTKIDSTNYNVHWATIDKVFVGLSNVDNTSDVNKPVSTAQQTALNLKAPLANPTFTGTVAGITKSMVGLANVDNTSDINKPVSTATQTALNNKEASISIGTTGQYWRGDKSWQTLDKAAVGLSAVLNVAQEPAITAGTTSQYWKGDKSWATLDKTAVGLANVLNVAQEPAITSGTTGQYWRGDKSWQTLDKAAVGLSAVLNVAQEPAITSGTTGQYWRGDKSWQTLDKTAVGLANVLNVAQEPAIASGTTSQYWRGDKTWVALVGLPAGGTTGQVLSKVNGTDYNVTWATVSGGGSVASASETVQGIVELATAAETTTGTDNSRAIHPAGLQAQKGIANGIAPLDASGLIPSSLLPDTSSMVVKTSATSRTSNTTLTNDPHLTFTVAAGDVWEFEVVLICTAASGTGSTTNFNAAWSVPTGTTGWWEREGVWQQPSITGTNSGLLQTPTTARTAKLAEGTQGMTWKAVMTFTTAGSVTFQWAQNTSNAAAVTLEANSFMSCRQLA